MRWQEIRKLRAHLNLTQQQMADRLGVPRNTYKQWELGRRWKRPSAAVVNLLEALRRAIREEKP